MKEKDEMIEDKFMSAKEANNLVITNERNRIKQLITEAVDTSQFSVVVNTRMTDINLKFFTNLGYEIRSHISGESMISW